MSHSMPQSLRIQQHESRLSPTQHLSLLASSKLGAGLLPPHTLVSQLPVRLEQVWSHSTLRSLSFQRQGSWLSSTPHLSLSASSKQAAGCLPLHSPHFSRSAPARWELFVPNPMSFDRQPLPERWWIMHPTQLFTSQQTRQDNHVTHSIIQGLSASSKQDGKRMSLTSLLSLLLHMLDPPTLPPFGKMEGYFTTLQFPSFKQQGMMSQMSNTPHLSVCQRKIGGYLPINI